MGHTVLQRSKYTTINTKLIQCCLKQELSLTVQQFIYPRAFVYISR